MPPMMFLFLCNRVLSFIIKMILSYLTLPYVIYSYLTLPYFILSYVILFVMLKKKFWADWEPNLHPVVWFAAALNFKCANLYLNGTLTVIADDRWRKIWGTLTDGTLCTTVVMRKPGIFISQYLWVPIPAYTGDSWAPVIRHPDLSSRSSSGPLNYYSTSSN